MSKRVVRFGRCQEPTCSPADDDATSVMVGVVLHTVQMGNDSRPNRTDHRRCVYPGEAWAHLQPNRDGRLRSEQTEYQALTRHHVVPRRARAGTWCSGVVKSRDRKALSHGLRCPADSDVGTQQTPDWRATEPRRHRWMLTARADIGYSLDRQPSKGPCEKPKVLVSTNRF